MCIIILMGKSGSGKSTIMNYIINNYNYDPIITHTTRPIRENERNGIDYIFDDEITFKKDIANNKYIEWRKYNTKVNTENNIWYYGTQKFILDKNKNYIVILDIKGSKAFKTYYKGLCYTFYINSSDSIRKKRAILRGSFDITEWRRRLQSDEKDFDISKITENTDCIVNNENHTIAEISSEIIQRVTYEK
jgi:guanylate kinase